MTGARSTSTAWAEGALLGAAVAGAVAALAVSRGAADASAWLALSGLGALAVGPVVGALRATRPWPAVAWSIPLGGLVALPILVMLARVLKATTHHRPLGAATFAVLATAVVLGAIAVVARLVTARERGGRIARAALAALVVLSALAALGLVVPGLSSGKALPIPLLEVGLALLLGIAAAVVKLPDKSARAVRVAGPLLWAALVAGGLLASNL